MNISRKRRLRSLKGCYLVFTGFHSIFVHTSRLERKLSWQRCTMSLPSFYWVSVGLAFTWQRGIVSWKAFYRVFPSFLFTKKNREPIGRWDGCTNHRFNTLTKQNNRKTKQNKRNRRRINRNNEVSAGAFQCNTHSRRKKFDEKKKTNKNTKQTKPTTRPTKKARSEDKNKRKKKTRRFIIESRAMANKFAPNNRNRSQLKFGSWPRTVDCPLPGRSFLFFSIFLHIFFYIFIFCVFFLGGGYFFISIPFLFFCVMGEIVILQIAIDTKKKTPIGTSSLRRAVSLVLTEFDTVSPSKTQ